MKAFSELMLYGNRRRYTHINNGFTVNIWGKQVQFAGGNLQAVLDRDYDVTGCTSEDSPIFKIADNQWDIIGSAPGNTTFKSGTTIDLFGWSWLDAINTVWGISVSENYEDYIPEHGLTNCGPVLDWGKAINDEYSWRTLTADEWSYLINYRIVNGDSGEGFTCQRVTLKDHGKGLLIYPDDYINQIENTEWIEISSIPAECVFLPLGAFRSGLNISSIDIYSMPSSGIYASSSGTHGRQTVTIRSSTSAYPEGIVINTIQAYVGCSVRLVRDIN